MGWLDWFRRRPAETKPRSKAHPSGVRAYDAATAGRRGDAWSRTASGPNSEVSGAGPILRNRSRDLCRNNPHAAKAISSLSTLIVGDGIHPRSATGDVALDARVNDLWRAWAEDAESTGVLDWSGLQVLAVRAMLESGEVLVRRRPRRLEDGLAVPLQLQILEADYLDETVDAADAKTSVRDVQGVRFDGRGRRVAYWIRDEHPSDGYAGMGYIRSESRLVGAGQIAHLYEVLRPGQVRGVPWLAPVMLALRDLDDYADAERVRKRIEASVAAFVTGGDDDAELGADDESLGPTVRDADGNEVESLEPGMILRLRGAKQVSFNHPQAVGGYAEYKRVELTSIAAGARMPYATLTGDLTAVNYSSMRAGHLDVARTVGVIQRTIVIRGLCRPVWRWWVEMATAAGLLPERPEGYPVRWSRPVVEALDRGKELDADERALLMGAETWADVVARRTGRTVDEQLAEIDEIQAKAEALGVVLSWTGPDRTSEPEPDPEDGAEPDPEDTDDDKPADDAADDEVMP